MDIFFKINLIQKPKQDQGLGYSLQILFNKTSGTALQFEQQYIC